ncbi:hypothetical protein LZ554_001856 [Drepanopeziza brunnea f. sp. 'monogermtubi']|nr:hypothetical protein LZ554_001856 [Drepanopeziza brunnea f. sp. 'monogermtubi']
MVSADGIIAKVEAILASAKKYKGDRSERYQLMKQVDLLYMDLEDPMDAMLRQWSFMNMATSLNMMVRLGAFEKMPEEGSISATELGAMINLEPGVIVRLMRMLTSTGIIALAGEDTYAHTPKSKAYLDGAAMDFFNMCINMFGCYLTWPEYFKTHTPEELIDLRKTPYTYAYGQEGQTFYEVLHADADRFTMFNKAMMQQEASLPTLGMFPFSSLKPAVEAEPDRTFVVDIGGGRGQSLLLIQRETGDSFGTGSRLVLQDRPFVLDSVPQELLKGIEKCPYDFYTEQPVKNAHIYFLRRITHNYQDGVCTTILTNIAAAMGPTSRLLIAEAVIPARTTPGEDLAPYWMDMVMISIGGKERSERDFAALLAGAGLHLVKIWYCSTGTHQAVIEARLKRG